MKAYGRVEALGRHEWTASLSGCITPVLTKQETGSAPKPFWTVLAIDQLNSQILFL
jgi:hypothetical protein